MTDFIRIVLDCRVVPYVRMTRRGKWWAPDAQRYMDRQAEIKQRMVEATGWCGHAVFPKPQRLSVRIALRGAHFRGDIDNYAKAILDAARDVLWTDDQQIDELYVERTRSAHDNFEMLVTKRDVPDPIPLEQDEAIEVVLNA